MKRIPFVVLGLALIAAGCGWLSGKTAAPTAQRGGEGSVPTTKILRVGVAPIYPPLIFKRGTQIVGVEVDLAKALSEEMKRQVTFVELQWSDLIPALQERRIDIIMSGMTITDARKQLVTFAHPYLRVGEMALIRRSDATRLRPSSALNAKKVRVGFITATTGEGFARNHLQKATREGFDSFDAGVAALRAGDIDAFLADSPAVWRVMGGIDGPEHQLTGIYEPMTDEYLAWAVHKDDHGFRELLDTILHQWHTSGKLEQMLKPWIHVRGAKPK